MQNSDNEFFEAYKKLEKLCSEIYNCANGVSKYIEEMKKAEISGKYKISDWETFYKNLKHSRYIRNKIAHESGDILYSTKADVEDVCNIYNSILNQKDPLAVLAKINNSKSKNITKTDNYNYNNKDEDNYEKNNFKLAVGIFVFGIFIVLLLLVLVFNNLGYLK